MHVASVAEHRKPTRRRRRTAARRRAIRPPATPSLQQPGLTMPHLTPHEAVSVADAEMRRMGSLKLGEVGSPRRFDTVTEYAKTLPAHERSAYGARLREPETAEVAFDELASRCAAAHPGPSWQASKAAGGF